MIQLEKRTLVLLVIVPLIVLFTSMILFRRRRSSTNQSHSILLDFPPLLQIFIFFIIFIIFYFLLIRPQQIRHKEHQYLMSTITKKNIDNILKELIYTQDGKMIIDPRYTDFAKMSKIYIVKKYGNIQDFLKFAKEEINNTYNTQNFNKLYDVLKELFILSFAK
jgi:preprotein translocase YajC subunit